MRYHHCFAVFSDSEVLHASFETVTDKRGVEFAIKHFLAGKTAREQWLAVDFGVRLRILD